MILANLFSTDSRFRMRSQRENSKADIGFSSDWFTFTDEEKALICLAVRGHRRRHEHMKPIEELFYESDKRSRMCLSCMAEKKCNWNEEEKNMEIII